MSKTTISTGAVLFGGNKPGGEGPDNKQTCHIIILADFSGRDHRGLNDVSTLATRKAHAVDRDNFDEVFAKLNVQLELPLADEVFEFEELDDMHPDFIYERVPLFARFRSLKRRLQNPDTFDVAAAEISGWQQFKEKDSAAAATEINLNTDSLLDNLLAGTVMQEGNDEENIQRLIEDIVAPYVIPAADPRKEEMLAAVDQAVSHLMRKLLHHHAFQSLESVWRSLYLLVCRLETNSKLRVSILDISRQELIDDCLNANNSASTALYKLLVESRASSGASPYSFILTDYIFNTEPGHAVALEKMAEIAKSGNACVCAGGSVRIAGCESLYNTPDPADWQLTLTDEFVAQWQALRNNPATEHLGLFAPRFLLRMPYGKRASPVEQIDFEELPETDFHEFYLWGNSAWLAVILLAQHYSRFGWRFSPGQLQQIDDLPLHVFSVDGEELITPCGEINITDTAVNQLSDKGLAAIRSIVARDSVLIPSFRSLASHQTSLAGPWG